MRPNQSAFMRVYSRYINNYDDSLKALEAVSHKPVWQDFINVIVSSFLPKLGLFLPLKVTNTNHSPFLIPKATPAVTNKTYLQSLLITVTSPPFGQ